MKRDAEKSNLRPAEGHAAVRTSDQRAFRHIQVIEATRALRIAMQCWSSLSPAAMKDCKSRLIVSSRRVLI